MNGVEKWDVDMPSTSESQYPAISIQEGSETQLQTGRVSETAKALGFTRSLVNVAYLEIVVFFYDFQGLGGIRSTWGKHPSKNTYVTDSDK